MEIRPYGVTYVKAGKDHFLAVAQYDSTLSVIFKWNGKTFEEWQKVASCKVRVNKLLVNFKIRIYLT